MKKHEEIEMKIYELLGVKVFRKLAVGIADTPILLITLRIYKGLSLKERLFKINHIPNNYFIGKIRSMEDVKNFKSQLFLNASIHISSILLTPHRMELIVILISILNLYCIMLQRYNWIRINETVRKMTPRYEKQKAKITHDLQETEKILPKHSYKIVNKNDKEKEVSFEELISKANIAQLKKYRTYLMYFKIKSEAIKEKPYYYTELKVELTAPLPKKKILKLEIDNQKNYERYNS